MAKKSNSKKRKQAAKKRAIAAKKQSGIENTTSSKKYVQKASNSPKNTKLDKIEAENAVEILDEAKPQQPVNSRGIAILLVVIVVILGGVVFWLYSRAQQATTETINQAGQEDLLRVTPSNENSLGPGAPSGSTTTPQDTGNPQPSSGSGSELQPQQPATPEQITQ